jgi:hypothetical protein
MIDTDQINGLLLKGTDIPSDKPATLETGGK